ncbi:hypothetical protein [Demequina iriomotensis]|uniref:hypothetical protein n=1 Tax=Demequina iriomotensis TaxID=1536641 RepID=UPI000782ECCE|nr:hypothetical protein [Demequina iriomotensis]
MAPQKPDQATIARLSLVKYQLETARQQAGAPAPLGNLALNTMQDAVEAAFALAAHRLDVKVSTELDKTVGDVVAALDSPQGWQGRKERLKTVNKARVGFKHHGIRAEPDIILDYLRAAEDSCSAIVREVYDVELGELSLIVLVTNARARGWLQTSRQLRDAGELRLSIGDLSAAFATLAKDARAGAPKFSVYPSRPARHGVERFERDWNGLVNSVHSIADYLRVFAMGVEPREYAFFRAHVPDVSFIGNTDEREYHFGIMNGAEELDDAIYDRLVRFIVDTSLQLDARRFPVPEQRYDGGWSMFRRIADDITPPEER